MVILLSMILFRDEYQNLKDLRIYKFLKLLSAICFQREHYFQLSSFNTQQTKMKTKKR